VEPPRRTFCSQECVAEHRIRSSGEAVRIHVRRRDKGVCAKCGLDTEAFNRQLKDLRERGLDGYWRRSTDRYCTGSDGRLVLKRTVYERDSDEEIQEREMTAAEVDGRMAAYRWLKNEQKQLLLEHGFSLREFFGSLGYVRSRSLWEADHIVPVCEGGGECGLDNYQTLCVPCHREETRKLARKRADERKGQLRLPIGDE
jgi:5-methylcytosine-specific restriction endonuclease McrA